LKVANLSINITSCVFHFPVGSCEVFQIKLISMNSIPFRMIQYFSISVLYINRKQGAACHQTPQRMGPSAEIKTVDAHFSNPGKKPKCCYNKPLKDIRAKPAIMLLPTYKI